MRLSCNFVNVYTIAYRVLYTRTCVHARISNRQPREDSREETRVPDKSARILVCVRLAAPTSAPDSSEVGEDVRVGVGVGLMEFQL